MKGASRFLYSIFSSAFLGGIAFLSCDNLILASVVALLCMLAVFFLFIPMLADYRKKERIRHECYQFVNAFIITLSVCSSLEHSYKVASGDIGGEFALLAPKIAHMSASEKTEYLRAYFNMDIYDMFVSVLHLYLDRGGDVLNLSSELLNELARIEETGTLIASKSAKNAFQFAFMWIIAIVVIVFVRFGLNTFFSSLKQSPMFLLGIAAFFLFVIVAVYIYLTAYVGATQKEKEYGKAI